MEISKSTKVYIAGCGGMLGEAVYRLFDAACRVKATDIDLNEPWLESADVRNHGQMAESIKKFQPDIVINLAARTDLELCEKDPSDAWAVNAYGAENLGLLALESGAPYVYISSAGIFDGLKEFYDDFDEPAPLSVYGKSKFYAEAFAARHIPRHYVLRAGWMMGGGPKKDKKFVNKIYKQILDGARVLNVVDDKLGTPTYTADFAKGMMRLLESDRYGLYNQVCGGGGSRYDVAVEFVRLLGLSDSIRVQKVASDFFQKDYFAPRPRSEQLVNLKLNRLNLNGMRDWRVCLAEYAEVFRADLKSRMPAGPRIQEHP